MSRLTEKLKNGNYICGIIKGGFVDNIPIKAKVYKEEKLWVIDII